MIDDLNIALNIRVGDQNIRVGRILIFEEMLSLHTTAGHQGECHKDYPSVAKQTYFGFLSLSLFGLFSCKATLELAMVVQLFVYDALSKPSIVGVLKCHYFTSNSSGAF